MTRAMIMVLAIMMTACSVKRDTLIEFQREPWHGGGSDTDVVVTNNSPAPPPSPPTLPQGHTQAAPAGPDGLTEEVLPSGGLDQPPVIKFHRGESAPLTGPIVTPTPEEDTEVGGADASAPATNSNTADLPAVLRAHCQENGVLWGTDPGHCADAVARLYQAGQLNPLLTQCSQSINNMNTEACITLIQGILGVKAQAVAPKATPPPQPQPALERLGKIGYQAPPRNILVDQRNFYDRAPGY